MPVDFLSKASRMRTQGFGIMAELVSDIFIEIWKAPAYDVREKFNSKIAYSSILFYCRRLAIRNFFFFLLVW